MKGCINFDHIVFEDHTTNLSRKKCHEYVTCPCSCKLTFASRKCPGHAGNPKCMQVEPCNREDDDKIHKTGEDDQDV